MSRLTLKTVMEMLLRKICNLVKSRGKIVHKNGYNWYSFIGGVIYARRNFSLNRIELEFKGAELNIPISWVKKVKVESKKKEQFVIKDKLESLIRKKPQVDDFIIFKHHIG